MLFNIFPTKVMGDNGREKVVIKPISPITFIKNTNNKAT